MDGDPDANPYDDLRHYAYEGDGNSGGSLSSLNRLKFIQLKFLQATCNPPVLMMASFLQL